MPKKIGWAGWKKNSDSVSVFDAFLIYQDLANNKLILLLHCGPLTTQLQILEGSQTVKILFSQKTWKKLQKSVTCTWCVAYAMCSDGQMVAIYS